MIREAIAKLLKKQDLTEAEATETMSEIMSGNATEAQIGAYIIALRMKGETVDEISGSAKVMRKFATQIKVSNDTIIDTCGTGGDGAHTFNISTASAFVLASCGLAVAKHGNRSVSSSCGSADVLEALGVKIGIAPEKVEECINQIGIGFLFAPALHGAMKYAIGPRKQIGARTVFNILGPLTNPASANYQVLGVYDGKLIKMLANVLKKMGTKAAWVVHGQDGLDEISLTKKTKVAELKKGKVRVFDISPKQFGLKTCKISDLKGGNAQDNAQIIRDIFDGKKSPKRDIVLLNAAAGLYVSGKAKNIKEGLKIAAEAIDSGKVLNKLNELIKFTTSS